MSTAAPAHVAYDGAGRVGGAAAVRAEGRRWPGSAAARLPAIGLGAAVLQGVLYLVGSTRHGWAALTAWQILWVSFLGPVATGLLAGLLGRRETDARGGGAWWRPVTGRLAHVAAFVVLAGYALVMQLAVLLTALPFGWADGLSAPGPVGHLVLVAVAQWFAMLALLALAHQVALRRGLLAATGLGLGWALAGTFAAETAGWWWQPWAWTVRALLPLTGTHANGVPLEPGSALLAAPVWPPLAASTILAVAVAGVGSRPWRRRILRRAGRADVSGRPAPAAIAVRLPRRWRAGPSAALIVSLRGTAVVPLLVAAAATVPTGLLVWSDPAYTRQLVALALLPVGTTVLPVLVWQASAPAWRSVSLHPVSAATLAGRLAALVAGVVAAFALLTGFTLRLAGVGWASAALFVVAAAATGTLLALWHLWLAIRLHPGVALAAGAIGTLLALVVGGTGLAGLLWPVVPWAWAATATSPHRLAWCVPAGVALCLGLLVGCRRAGRRAAARSAD